MSSDTDDQKRKNQSHAENGNKNTPEKEMLAPDMTPVFQNAGIDNGIVE